MTRLTVDGMSVDIGAPPERTLATFLRDDVGTTAVKIGCGEGSCGACVAVVDGRAVTTCLVHLARVDGAEVATAASLSGSRVGRLLVEAILDEGGLQCGFCTPGVVAAVVAMADDHGAWSEREVRAALAGHICRCTGYAALVRAAHRALARASS